MMVAKILTTVVLVSIALAAPLPQGLDAHVESVDRAQSIPWPLPEDRPWAGHSSGRPSGLFGFGRGNRETGERWPSPFTSGGLFSGLRGSEIERGGRLSGFGGLFGGMSIARFFLIRSI